MRIRDQKRLKMRAQIVALAIIASAPKMSAAELLNRELVAAVLVLEAGGEGRKGMEAINEVIRTRAAQNRIAISSVVLQPRQFSCLNRLKPLEAVRKARSSEAFPIAYAIAGNGPTHWTHGADHYHAGGARPQWAANKRPIAVIGRHSFYKL